MKSGPSHFSASREADWLLANTCYLLSAALPLQAALAGRSLIDSLLLWGDLVGAVIIGVLVLTGTILVALNAVGALVGAATWGTLTPAECARIDEVQARADLRARLLDIYAPFVIEWAAAGISEDLIADALRRMSCGFAFSGRDVAHWLAALLHHEEEQRLAAERRRRLRELAGYPLPCA